MKEYQIKHPCSGVHYASEIIGRIRPNRQEETHAAWQNSFINTTDTANLMKGI
jgi:hypothetical protein